MNERAPVWSGALQKMAAAQVAYDAIEPKRVGEGRFRQAAGRAFHSVMESDSKPYGHISRWSQIANGLQAFGDAVLR